MNLLPALECWKPNAKVWSNADDHTALLGYCREGLVFSLLNSGLGDLHGNSLKDYHHIISCIVCVNSASVLILIIE